MAITIDDFSKIWASTSPLTPYSFSDDNYKSGWNFIGSAPPSRQMWDFLQKNNDEKMQYLADNYLPLSGGTMTGDITLVDGGKAISDTITNVDSANFVDAESGYTIGEAYARIIGGKILQFQIRIDHTATVAADVEITVAKIKNGYRPLIISYAGGNACSGYVGTDGLVVVRTLTARNTGAWTRIFGIYILA